MIKIKKQNDFDDQFFQTNYSKGTSVWIADDKEIWISGNIIENSTTADGHFLTEVKLKFSKKSELPLLRNPEFLLDSNDLTSLSYIQEPDILYALKNRFERECIYTYFGIVLVAVNPYKDVSLYDKSIYNLYRNGNVRQLDPHIFGISEEALSSLDQQKKNQSIIISGESGAGKTVSANHVFRYLTQACTHRQAIDSLIIASNSLIEAFGNAKTVQNDNSSRFGKFIRIFFDDRLNASGAQLETYLLEKSRISFQGKCERNYHIFYQMSTARESSPLLKGFNMKHDGSYKYLCSNEDACMLTANDSKNFEETINSFKILGFGDDEIRDIFAVLIGILHFGNLSFSGEMNNKKAVRKNSANDLSRCCELLGLNEEDLAQKFTYQQLAIRREVVHRQLNSADADALKDGICKYIYESLFRWIIKKINDRLSEKSLLEMNFIGVLDIYGFEVFPTNSFEQLCINFANELLQQQFYKYVFKLEQEEYVKENICWSFIDFPDNQACLLLFEARLGIFSLLDQECQLLRPSDDNFYNELKNSKQCQESCSFKLPAIASDEFLVVHYAGTVKYCVRDFVKKNLDTVNESFDEVLRNSRNCFLVQLLQAGFRPQLQKSSKRTVGSQFRKSLSTLMDTLNSTNPHYVRCIKPNDEKLPFTFNNARSIQQITACSLLETLKISAAGYPTRWKYESFFDRYFLLLTLKERNAQSTTLSDKCRQICERFLNNGSFEFGSTKIFFRSGQIAFLEQERHSKLNKSALVIQNCIRNFIATRRDVRKIKTATRIIQNVCFAWLAWRRMKFLQMHRAAIVIQSIFKMVVQRKRYLLIKNVVLSLQSYCRAMLLRSNFQNKKKAAIIIQRYVRTWLKRKQTNLIPSSQLQSRQINDTFSKISSVVLEINNNDNDFDTSLLMAKEPKSERANLTVKSVNVNCSAEEYNTLEKCQLIFKIFKECISSTAFKEEFVKRLNEDTVIDEYFFNTLRKTVKNVLHVLLMKANKSEMLPARNMDDCLSLSTTAEENGQLSPSLQVFDRVGFVNALVNECYQNQSCLPVLLILAFRYFDVLGIPEKSIQLYFEVENAITVLLFVRFNVVFSVFILAAEYETAKPSSIPIQRPLRNMSSNHAQFSTPAIEHLIQKYKLRQSDPQIILSHCQWQIRNIYKNLFHECIAPRICPLLVPALLEFKSDDVNKCIRKHGVKENKKSEDKHMEMLIHHLDTVYNAAMTVPFDAKAMQYLFSDIAKLVLTVSFNELMFRRDLCNLRSGVRIKHNVCALIRWFEKHQFVQSGMILQPLLQVANLLQARKTVADIQGFNEICSTLKVSQIVNVLRHYSPVADYEPKVSASFICNVKQKLLALRKQTETGNEPTIIPENYLNANDLLDFEPCDDDLKTAEIPKSVEAYAAKI
ncbi:Unconventional myosin-Va [Trichinella pseudospiralis]|uniref:Unconventional myosin-Va n=1 Tax=Trichinella pseudospiralis TaxID=6337 RepID=A0A0V1JHL0_TRIPS|nr:Unconventional myosin-Va [Trichinella pseudospiralis]KRZ25029.1 Unconventional myosin-Va [Trichinella pseudospiralis]KRZ34431.1 Unconventional myosin-Va [Trichinella pseudospiralis]